MALGANETVTGSKVVAGKADQKINALRTWHYALADRRYSPARIAAMGSSTTEGEGQTGYDRNYLARLRDILRSRYPSGVTGGENYVAAWGNPSTFTWPVARSAGVTTDSNRGWGIKAVMLNNTGQTLTYTFTGTSFQVWYSQYAGGGSFSVEVDSTVVATVNSNGVSDRNAKWTSAMLTAGPHTVIVRWVSGASYVHGIASFNGDENAGIHVYNGGHSGKRTQDFLGDISAWAARLGTIQPHLVILQLGANDYMQSIPSLVMKENLKTIIGAVRDNCTTSPSFVIFGAPQMSGATYAEPYSNYVGAWLEIAAGDTGGLGGSSAVTFFDLSRFQPSPYYDNSPSLYTADLTHSTNKGAAHVADMLASFLEPA